MTIRLLLADDSDAFREGFALLVRSREGMELVGQATSGRQAVTRAELLQPDVVVMDLNMPDGNGIEATRAIAGSSPHIKVLVLTMLEDDQSILAAMQAGAVGYLVKGANQEEIARALSAVAAGEVIFGPAVARQVLSRLAEQTERSIPFPDLTSREREVLALLARGESNATIARTLAIAHKTVRNHLSSVFLKLQVTDRSQAIVKARDAGLGTD